jgi:hypothetical protein
VLTSRRFLLPLLGALALASCDKREAPTAGITQPSEFVLDLRFLGTPPTAPILSSFQTAATIIRGTITGPLTNVTLPSDFTNVSECDASLTGFKNVPREVISGVVVYISVVSIDGVGGTLGSAGPCIVRNAAQNYLPALGVMRLDSADVNNLAAGGYLTTVILHELIHVLGFGTIWIDNELLSGEGTPDARFLGVAARAACADVHGGGTACATTVPVHSSDGAGSRDTHWRESVFTTEVMTPFLEQGANPYSAMTIQSLADLGYVVSTALADPYTIGAVALRAAPSTGEPVVEFAEPIRPRYSLDAQGGLIPFPRR